jgi:hypothetical protein
MKWLARLRKTQAPPDTDPTETTKTIFVVSVGTPAGLSENSGGHIQAANDVAHSQDFDREALEERAAIMEFDGGLSRHQAEALAGIGCDVDRHGWPHTEAMNTGEIDAFMARVLLFTKRGVDNSEAEQMADDLVLRDREEDDRRLCLECLHLQQTAGLWLCSRWRLAGLSVAGVPGEVVKLLQRCNAFKKMTPREGS